MLFDYLGQSESYCDGCGYLLYYQVVCAETEDERCKRCQRTANEIIKFDQDYEKFRTYFDGTGEVYPLWPTRHHVYNFVQ